MKTLPQLDSFARSYIETALWSSIGDDDKPLDRDHDARDLALETVERIAADCERFQRENGDTINAAIETGEVKSGPDFNEYDRAAHDFWLTRNGHGAGFWDGDWPEPFAQQLTDAAHAFGECNLYVGDNGMIYAA